ncbi:unnamed protein product [Caenorhabditis nigoni]
MILSDQTDRTQDASSWTRRRRHGAWALETLKHSEIIGGRLVATNPNQENVPSEAAMKRRCRSEDEDDEEDEEKQQQLIDELCELMGKLKIE